VPRQLTTGDFSRTAILRGIDVLANTIRATLGPKGRNVMIAKLHGSPVITKDGVTVAKGIELKGALENLGVRMIREAAEKTDKVAGDGTTTSTILAHAIFRDGVKAIAEGANPNALKRGIDKAVHRVVQEIQRISKPIGGDDVVSVGTISANGDASIGALVASAIDKIGKHGVITVEESKSTETWFDVVQGMQFDRGLLSPYFVTDVHRNRAVLDDPFILIHEKKISAVRELVPLLQKVNAMGKSLLIIAEDVDGEALATLIANKNAGVLKTAAVKAPSFGDRRRANLEDIAILTGATVINPELGLKLENVGLDHLGGAGKITIDSSNTTIVGGAGDQVALSHRIQGLNYEFSHATSDSEREYLNERLTRLTGGAAVIRVGASTESELQERKERVDDAVRATRAAIEEGVIAGGGVVLLRAQQCLNELRLEDEDEIRGLEIVGRALEAPSRQIAENAGRDGGVIVQHILAANKLNYGFNAATERFEDLFKGGVIDSAKVTRSALQNAASIAGLMITSDAAVTDEEPKEPQPVGTSRVFAAYPSKRARGSSSSFRYSREPTGPLPWRPRFVQAEIFDLTETPPMAVFDAFSIGTTYSIGIFIGPASDTAIVSDAVFPEEELPPNPDGHELTVVLTEPTLTREPQVATIFLPPRGKSDTCRFELHIPEEYEGNEIEARVIVLHENRVIQTAILRGPVLPNAIDIDDQIRLSKEVIVRTNLDELGDSYRQSFDAVLLFNHDSRGAARGYAIAGKKAEFFLEPEGVEETKKYLNEAVSLIVKRPAAFKSLRSPATIELLGNIARHGGYLYQQLIKPRSTSAKFAAGKRIQVIVAKLGAQFPVEYFYDHSLPGKNAGLCSGAEQALIDGACPKSCSSDTSQSLCPLGFWGLSRVIERHTHDQSKLSKMKGFDFAFGVEPVKSRRQLKILDYGLLAASNKVDENGRANIQAVEKELRSATGKRSARVDTWEDWITQVDKKSPHLLILLPHTLEENRMQVLEISKNQRLSIEELKEKHIFGRKKSPPVVLLLGCDTDAPAIPYQSFPMNFRQNGAAVVISTTATILGWHAAPVAIALLKKFAELRKIQGRSFGEIMLEVRRSTLTKFPMTLCLTAYGDTDWLL
jgi:chaperonin GroEL